VALVCLCTMYALGFLCVFALDMCEKSVRNGTNKRHVDFAFILISKEEREMDIERKFVALSE
jgi:hypothetical protein